MQNQYGIAMQKMQSSEWNNGQISIIFYMETNKEDK